MEIDNEIEGTELRGKGLWDWRRREFSRDLVVRDRREGSNDFGD
jgi:hypothetical protein